MDAHCLSGPLTEVRWSSLAAALTDYLQEDKDDERQAMERLVQVALPEQVQRSAFRALFTEEKPVALDKVLW